jgi:hypothetical protein
MHKVDFFHVNNVSIASWQSIDSRRKLFEQYAASRKFDPLNPENWYAQPRKNILSTQVFVAHFMLNEVPT